MSIGQQTANLTENDNVAMRAQIESETNYVKNQGESLIIPIPSLRDSFIGIEVKRAKLHQAFQLPGGGDTTDSLYSATKVQGVARGRGGIYMKYGQDGLFCEYKGEAFIVPLANVVVVFI